MGIPLCVVGGLLYAWTSGKGIIDGCINAYGALYKIPGAPFSLYPYMPATCMLFLRSHEWTSCWFATIECALPRSVAVPCSCICSLGGWCARANRTSEDIKLFDTGVMVIGEVNAMTAHLMNILWLIGTFTFAIVLGVVTEDIVQTVIVRFSEHLKTFVHKLLL